MFRSNARFLFALVVCLLLRLPSLCSYNFCPSCGFKVSGAKFCSDCGAGPFVNEAQSDAASAKSGDEESFVLKSFGEGEETIESFLPQFLEVRESEVSAATFKTESGFWFQSAGLLSTIGSTPLSLITSSTFETHLQALRSRSCSIRTQQLHRSAYIAFLKYGKYLSKIEYSAEEVRMVKGRKGNKGKLRDEIVPFTSEEVGKLLDGAGSPMHRCLFGLAVGLGLRPSEALNVRWEDFEDDKIRIRGTKTDISDAMIPMTGLAKREVERWREECKRHGSSFLAAKSHLEKSTRGFALKVRKVEYVQIRKVVLDWSVSSAWEHDFEDVTAAAKFMNVSVAAAKRAANNLQEHVGGWEVRRTTKLVDVCDESVVANGSGYADEDGMVGVTVLKLKKKKRGAGVGGAPEGEVVFREDNAKEECAKYLNVTEMEKEEERNDVELKGRLFVNAKNGEPVSSFKKALSTACTRAEIDCHEGRRRRVFPYLLRHSFATLAATSSPPVPIVVAQKVMRHSSSKLLLEVYARAGEGVVREGLSNFRL
ncbi:hypothetical protein TrST_g9509 [Triparma strigata]|uniref:Tyr recombinase domain-containing protein n=1 Tax=Triparma strigata TaxID=1606541 RepID=A0A9W7EFP0_9STRA|nr:hypothetical protein TrST_g9509 [Triparma strigata]